MNSRILGRAIPLAAVLAALTCGSASAHGDEPTAMPLGAAATAPTGFLEMCERAPGECLSVTRPTEQMLSDVRIWAGRARWASVFEAAGVPTAPAAIPRTAEVRPVARTIVAPRRSQGVNTETAVRRAGKAVTPEQIRAAKDDRRKDHRSAQSKTPQPAPIPDEPAPAQPPFVQVDPLAPRTSGPVAVISTEALETISRRFNRAIRRSSDAAAYGREDVWVLPGGRRPTGDCEDYVLAKRRALIDDGVNPAALSIAVVRTRRGETHAVLLVATPEGEQVLDNLSPWVLPWREAPYEWLERQAPGQPLVWMRAAA